MHRLFLFHAFDCAIGIHDFTQSAPCNNKLAVSTLYTYIYIYMYIHFFLTTYLHSFPFPIIIIIY